MTIAVVLFLTVLNLSKNILSASSVKRNARRLIDFRAFGRGVRLFCILRSTYSLLFETKFSEILLIYMLATTQLVE